MLIAEVLYGFTAMFIFIRMIAWNEKSVRMVVLDAFSAMCVVFAFFFAVFSPTGMSTSTAVATNLTSLGNVIITTNTTTVTPHILVTSTGFIMLVVFTSSWVLFMAILMLYDFIAARGNVP